MEDLGPVGAGVELVEGDHGQHQSQHHVLVKRQHTGLEEAGGGGDELGLGLDVGVDAGDERDELAME